jgi:hypothetical protein
MTKKNVMNSPRYFLALMLMLAEFAIQATPLAGFCLPDSVEAVKIRFKMQNNLIIIPVIINNTIEVNLILDTGCRNLVLFGKEFSSLLTFDDRKRISFSGLGDGEPVTGRLALNNEIQMGSIVGQAIPIIVVEEKNIFKHLRKVHGVIGYDVFLKFEIEINSLRKEMTFRPANLSSPRMGYSTVPLTIVDSKPVMASSISSRNETVACQLMIDTGSSLGLLLKKSQRNHSAGGSVIGRGLNGDILGTVTMSKLVQLEGMVLENVATSVTECQTNEDDNASIGMGVLKDYIVVLNYCKSYASFKKLTA